MTTAEHTDPAADEAEVDHLKVGDLATVTGPLRVNESTPVNCVFLKPGETVTVIEAANNEGSVYVHGEESRIDQLIAESSLTFKEPEPEPEPEPADEG